MGLGLASLALHLMAGFTLEVSQRDLIITGFLQGAGLGLVFVPVSALTYVTLAPHLRGDGTALFSLMRNLGSSIGVSLVMALLSRNMWINQQQLGARIQVPQELLETLPSTTELLGLPARAILEVTRQAAEIAYINNFELLTWVSVAAMPMVFMFSRPGRNNAALPAG